MADYVPSRLAVLIHDIPRFDFRLHSVSPSFNISSSAYIDSLVAVSCVPSIWLVITMTALLLYMLSRCCVSHKYKHSFTALKWSLGCLATIACAVLLVGFYGNQTLHSGIGSVEQSTQAIADTVNNVTEQTRHTEAVVRGDVPAMLERLRQLFSSDSRPANLDIVNRLHNKLSSLGDNATTGVAIMANVSASFSGFHAEVLPMYVRLTETIRWPATMILLSLMVMLCSVLFVAVVRHSRWLLVFFSVTSLIAVIISYILGSAHTFAALGLADFCVSPDATVRSVVKAQLSGTQSADSITDYYLNCSHTSAALPWQQQLQSGMEHVQSMLAELQLVNDEAVKYYPSAKLDPLMFSVRENLDSMLSVFQSFSQLLQCRYLHSLYIQALQALCGPALVGLTVLLLSLLACGLLFTVLTWCDAHAWIHIQKRRDYLRVDNEDPYGTTCRRPPSLSALNTPSAPPASSSSRMQRGPLVLPPSTHQLSQQQVYQHRLAPTSLRTRTPPFPTAGHGSLRPFNNRVNGGGSNYRSGTLPTSTRFTSLSAGPLAPLDPPPYSAALLSTNEEHSDYDNYD